MALTNIEIINAALLKLGARKITSLSDGSAESDIAGTLYGPVRDALFALYPWGFAATQTALSTSAYTPTADYQYAFLLPADHVRTLSVGGAGSGAGVIFRQQAGHIETDESPMTLTYIRRVNESDQPPHFNMALMARLAAEFCVPLTENAARAEVLYRLADQELIRARMVDSQQDTPSALMSYSLIDARG